MTQKGQAVQKQPADLEKHIPVMLAEVLEALIAPAGNTKILKAQTKAGFARQPAKPEQNLVNLQSWQNKQILDGTFGNGGYSRAFLAVGARVLGLDRDPQAVKIGQALQTAAKGRFFIRETDFSKLDKAAEQAGFIPLDAVVLDIGVSSMQIDEGARGFSFRHNGPLDMRMGRSAVSAADVVNRVKANDLARIFYFYGEERFSTRIARMIEARRGQKPFTSTLDLAQSIVSMGLHKHEKIHAATRVFQALRIYVNDELGQLARALFAAERVLKPGGRLAVVTFHSLEDRLVKRFFNDRIGESPVSRYLPQQVQRAAQFIPLFKGAKQASAAEAALNPRSRSAKLRVGIRTEAAAAFENYDIFGLPKLPLLSEI